MPVETKMKRIIYLVGPVKSKIEGRKLPTARQVLQLFFYEHCENGHTIRQSSTHTLQQVMSKWNSGGIRVSDLKHCVVKLEKLHLTWQKLKKSAKSKSPTQREKEELFEENLDNIFDISRKDVMDNLSESKKEFLISQRNKNRRDFLPLDSPTSSRVSPSHSEEASMSENECSGTNSSEESTIEINEGPALPVTAADTDNTLTPNSPVNPSENNEEDAQTLSEVHPLILLLVRSWRINLRLRTPVFFL